MNIRGDKLKIDTRDVIEELDKRITNYQKLIKELRELDISEIHIKESLERQRSLIELRDIIYSIEKNIKRKERKYMCDAYPNLDNDVVSEFDLECKHCGHKFLEKDAYNWRINNRIVLCCPNCKTPSLFAKEN